MDPIKYCLCQKPVIGPIMWILSLCAFPPPFPSTNISLEKPGTVLRATFEAPVERDYHLILEFYFPSEQDRGNDKIIGDGYDLYCKSCLDECDQFYKNEKAESDYYGKVIPIRIVVRNLSDSTIVIDKTYQTLCSFGHDGKKRKDRDIGYIALTHGNFSIEVINIEAQPDLKGIQTKIMIGAGRFMK